MNKLKLTMTLLLATMSIAAFSQKASVNTSESNIEWTGKKITGQHEGNIKIKEGSLTLDENRITSGYFTVDMNSMTCTDIENEEYRKKLIGHLSNDDFFSVDKYPTASLKITKSSPFVDGKATVQGDLTIKNITKPVIFRVTKVGNTYTSRINIKRTKYDIKYGSASFFESLGDKAIDDVFSLNVKLVTE